MALPERTPAQLTSTEKRSVGQGLFRKCHRRCGVVNTVEDLASRFYVCPSCGYHHPMASSDWRKLLLDDAVLERWDEHILPADPLEFEDGKRYVDRISRAQATTGATEAIEIGRARLGGIPIAYGAYNFAFMGGSMGSVVGERITRLFERATSEHLPVVLLHASGGARMQEGILSLMQMAKTMSALGRFRSVKKPYISVLLHPTTGGVAASTGISRGRRQRGRTECHDRLRRPARDREYDQRQAAGWFSTLRIPARPRYGGHHRAARRNEAASSFAAFAPGR